MFKYIFELITSNDEKQNIKSVEQEKLISLHNKKNKEIIAINSIVLQIYRSLFRELQYDLEHFSSDSKHDSLPSGSILI